MCTSQFVKNHQIVTRIDTALCKLGTPPPPFQIMNIGTKETCILSRAEKKTINMRFNPTHSKSSLAISQKVYILHLFTSCIYNHNSIYMCIYVFDRHLVDGIQYSQITFFLNTVPSVFDIL